MWCEIHWAETVEHADSTYAVRKNFIKLLEYSTTFSNDEIGKYDEKIAKRLWKMTKRIHA